MVLVMLLLRYTSIYCKLMFFAAAFVVDVVNGVAVAVVVTAVFVCLCYNGIVTATTAVVHERALLMSFLLSLMLMWRYCCSCSCYCYFFSFATIVNGVVVVAAAAYSYLFGHALHDEVSVVLLAVEFAVAPQRELVSGHEPPATRHAPEALRVVDLGAGAHHVVAAPERLQATVATAAEQPVGWIT